MKIKLTKTTFDITNEDIIKEKNNIYTLITKELFILDESQCDCSENFRIYKTVHPQIKKERFDYLIKNNFLILEENLSSKYFGKNKNIRFYRFNVSEIDYRKNYEKLIKGLYVPINNIRFNNENIFNGVNCFNN